MAVWDVQQRYSVAGTTSAAPEVFLKRLQLLSFLAFAILGTTTSTAWADTIRFSNTGVATDGSLLVAGTADGNYSLLYSADPNGTTATATSAHPNWQQDSATAGWISPGSSGTQDWASGYYVYETLLDLTGYNPLTASLSGMIAADNEVAIYLNRAGSALYNGGGFSSSSPFLINSGFVNGINEVDFVVHNDGGPSGLMVDDTLATATTPTPEASTLLLIASGTVLGALVLRKPSLSNLTSR